MGLTTINGLPAWDPTVGPSAVNPTIQSLYQSVFESPLHYSPRLKLESRQVKEWKWVDDKATRLQITLRDDILFQDGTKMTMDDVRYSLVERARADKKLLVGGMLNTLSDIEVRTPGRRVEYSGEARIDGVPGTSAAIPILSRGRPLAVSRFWRRSNPCAAASARSLIRTPAGCLGAHWRPWAFV